MSPRGRWWTAPGRRVDVASGEEVGLIVARSSRPAPVDLNAAFSSLRLIVLVFVLVDVLTSLITNPVDAESSTPAAVVVAQLVLVTVAVAAVMWRRIRLSVVLLVVLSALTLTVGPTGEELTALLVIGVVAGVRVRPRPLVVVAIALVLYAVAFGLDQERYYPGWGWPAGLTVLGFAVVGVATGLVVRVLLRADDRRRRRVEQLEEENAEIRARERTRLADDLQSVVTRGLAEIGAQLHDLAPSGRDRRAVRAGLARVDALSRSLLEELRALLEVLRREPAPDDDGSAARDRGRGWSRWFTVVTVRVGATVVFAVLVINAIVVHDPFSHPDLWVEAIGLAACGAALWRPWGTRVGALGAVLVLVLATVTHDTVGWDAVAIALLCLIGTAVVGVRRLWIVVVGLVGYGGLRALGPLDDPSRYLSLIAYAGVAGILLGVPIRHFLHSRAESDRRVDDLLVERTAVEAQERNAVARDLHDVVAHQLSVVTLVVMASGTSDDPQVLDETVGRVRRSTESAGLELDTLLHTMRGAKADAVRPTPSASPVSTAAGLQARLTEQGFRPEFVIDPAADALDPISRRTLVRIMQEAATNVLRYTAAGSPCRFELAIDPRGVALTVLSPLSVRERRSDLSLGWGLRGIRERIDLCHGTFAAGPARGQWRLAVTLPPPTPSDPVEVVLSGAVATS